MSSWTEKPCVYDEAQQMGSLRGKRILAVDDEPDILETIVETLEYCDVSTAGTYDTGLEMLHSNEYDIVILDIMGVKGLELLNVCVGQGFPTVMLTAPAMDPKYVIGALERGAASYMPKEDLAHLENRLIEVLDLLARGITPWTETIKRIDPILDEKYGAQWKKKLNQFLENIEKTTMTKPRKLS